MPKSIADNMKLLRPAFADPIGRNKIPSDCFIVTKHDLSGKYSIKNTFSSINDEILTFYDFHCRWIDLIDQSKEWLKQNGNNIEELKIN